jgi:hypothetical protein
MTQTQTLCPECGQPAGECYNLCPNSSAFYSPERERADEAFYGADRYDGWDDPDLDADYGSFVHPDDAVDPSGQREVRAGAFADDEIPF